MIKNYTESFKKLKPLIEPYRLKYYSPNIG